MDNHGHRKEIREAEINGEGADERMSSTLSEKTMYYAVRLENGNVLRVSSNQASVWMLLLQLLPPFAAVLILMLLLSGVFASRLSGKVVEPLNGLDLEHPDILMAAKYFERIGDHAVNIAEWVEYSITGNHRSGSSHTDNYFVEE